MPPLGKSRGRFFSGYRGGCCTQIQKQAYPLRRFLTLAGSLSHRERQKVRQRINLRLKSVSRFMLPRTPGRWGWVLLGCALTLNHAALGGFAPIVLTSGSLNLDIVVEATAAAPAIAGGYTTASMDNGLLNTGTSWYEQGYNLTNLSSGLPHAGSTFTSPSLP